MRKPKNLNEYTDVEKAARGLEKLAADIRNGSEAGMLIRWSININQWHPSWETKPRGEKVK